jgi:LPPG:FO 2-phospho-L-lactate transferase
VRTTVIADGRRLSFQDYFVRYRCEPAVSGIVYDGANAARPLPALVAALTSETLDGIVICPSNPQLSIAPMLAMPSLADVLRHGSRPVVAVSPIIGGKAVKGPAAKILSELGQEPSCLAVANYYRGLIDYLLIDSIDADQVDAIRALSIEPIVTDIMMRDIEDRRRLARACCDLLKRQRTPP